MYNNVYSVRDFPTTTEKSSIRISASKVNFVLARQGLGTEHQQEKFD